QGGDARESDHTMLRGNVAGGAGCADLTEYGSHVDNRASAGLEHPRDLRAHRVEDAGEIDLYDLAPAVDAELAGSVQLTADARVVRGYVQRAKAVDGGLRQTLAIFRVGNIASGKTAASAEVLSPISRTVSFPPSSFTSDTTTRAPS